MISEASRDDLASVLELLRSSSLPVAGVEEHIDSFLVARDDDDGPLTGSVGLETYDDVGLVRSLAVRPDRRGSGIGGELVERLLALARERKVGTLYLLTTTADRYFPRFGFERVPRSEADPRLEGSEELRGACPTSAVLMRRKL